VPGFLKSAYSLRWLLTMNRCQTQL
jgi:hypothetical protein